MIQILHNSYTNTSNQNRIGRNSEGIVHIPRARVDLWNYARRGDRERIDVYVDRCEGMDDLSNNLGGRAQRGTNRRLRSPLSERSTAYFVFPVYR